MIAFSNRRPPSGKPRCRFIDEAPTLARRQVLLVAGGIPKKIKADRERGQAPSAQHRVMICGGHDG